MSLLNNLRAPDGRPLRSRAEIMIWRNGLILLTHSSKPNNSWFGLPGGGVDDGESAKDAAVREALEEVGIAVRNVKETGEVHVGPNPPGMYGARARIFGGVHTILFKGDYVRIDNSIRGIEGDAMPYVWKTPKEAYDIFTKAYSENNDRGRHRITELQKYI